MGMQQYIRNKDSCNDCKADMSVRLAEEMNFGTPKHSEKYLTTFGHNQS